VPAAFFSIFLFILTFVMTFVHSLAEEEEAQKSKKRILLLLCKISNVILTIIGFIILMGTPMWFDIT
jgi:hypothetical protein